MKYCNIDTDYTPKITGKRDGDVAVVKNKGSFSNKEQEKEFDDFFIANYKEKTEFYYPIFGYLTQKTALQLLTSLKRNLSNS